MGRQKNRRRTVTRRGRDFLNRKIAAYGMAFLMILSAVIFVSACQPNAGGPSAGPDPSASSGAGGPSPDSTSTEALNPPPEMKKGYLGAREDLFIMAYTGREALNLNPFAEGESLFPVDPSGFYQPLYETLFRFNPEKADFDGILAERYAVASRSLTVTLKADLTWHDGYPISCQDVIYTLELHRQLGTPQGEALSREVEEIRALEPLGVVIALKPDAPSGAHGVMDVLTKLLILPRHAWEPVVGKHLTLTAVRELTDFPRIGSGAWSFVSEDTYAVTFSLFKKEDLPGETPSRLVIAKYKTKGLSSRALECGEIDFSLEGRPLRDVLEEEPLSIQSEDASLTPVYAGERVAGIAVNAKSRPLLGRRAFRQLLFMLCRPDASQPDDDPDEARETAADPLAFSVFALPGTVRLFDQKALADAVEPRSDEAVQTLMEEAMVTRDETTGKCLFEGEPIPSLSLTYPSEELALLPLLQDFAASCSRYGIDIAFDPVKRVDLENRYKNGDYELIYLPSDVDETPYKAMERLREILAPAAAADGTAGESDPGQTEATGEDQGTDREDDAGTATYAVELSLSYFREKEQVFATVFGKNLLPFMEDLTLRLLDEAVYIPLDAGKMESGILNDATQRNDAVNSLFANDVTFGDPVIKPRP